MLISGFLPIRHTDESWYLVALALNKEKIPYWFCPGFCDCAQYDGVGAFGFNSTLRRGARLSRGGGCGVSRLFFLGACRRDHPGHIRASPSVEGNWGRLRAV